VIGRRRIALQRGANLIGRDPEAAVWLDATGVPRRHAQIILEGGTATLEDLGSKNGTLLSDRPVRGPAVLRNADRIQIATFPCFFCRSSHQWSRPARRARVPC
jgi:pSer/pThr/pTyr-binding forkhead associated (FHA) protein